MTNILVERNQENKDFMVYPGDLIKIRDSNQTFLVIEERGLVTLADIRTGKIPGEWKPSLTLSGADYEKLHLGDKLILTVE